MRKWVLWVIVAATLVVSFAVMSGVAWLKRPLDPSEDVLAFLDELDQSISRQHQDWSRAEDIREKLQTGWERVRVRIQFVAEKDDLVRFGRTLDELKAAIAVEDVSMAKRNIEILRSVWYSIR